MGVGEINNWIVFIILAVRMSTRMERMDEFFFSEKPIWRKLPTEKFHAWLRIHVTMFLVDGAE